MGYSSGSAALGQNMIATPLSRQETLSNPRPLSWMDVVASRVVIKHDLPERINFAQKYIFSLALETLTVHKSSLTNLIDEDLERQVVKTVTQEIGKPFLVASTIVKFKEVPGVEKVKYKVHPQKNIILFSILVKMPQSNYALMKKLTELEYDLNISAREHGYLFEYRYFPYPYMTIDDLDSSETEF